MANTVYNIAKEMFSSSGLDWDLDDIRVMLIDSTGAAVDADDLYVSAISGDELSDTNYARSALAGLTVTRDEANDRAEMDANDLTFTSLGGTDTVKSAVLFKQVTNDNDSPLILWIDNPFPFITNGGDMTLQFNAEGILQMA